MGIVTTFLQHHLPSVLAGMSLCECGCGQLTKLATQNSTPRGWIKGQPLRFIFGHARNFVHGHASGGKRTREYRSYESAKARCQNSNNRDWNLYGGRGIEFRFDSFEAFYAELGSRPKGMTVDRVNNDGHYEVGNVRWATDKEQANNRRTS